MEPANPYVTTLAALRRHHPCSSGWKRLLDGLKGQYADDAFLPFSVILPISGLDDTLWGLRVLDDHPQAQRDLRLFAAWNARTVLHFNDDPRVSRAIEAAEGAARGTISEAAWAAAREAAGAAAREAAWAAAGAAAREAAREAAWAAAREAAWAAAGAAAWAAAREAAGAAAWAAAREAAWAAAWAAAREAAGAAAREAAGAAAWAAAREAAWAAASERLALLFSTGSFEA